MTVHRGPTPPTSGRTPTPSTLHVSRTASPGGITRVNWLLNAWAYGGADFLREVIKIMTAAWPVGPAGGAAATYGNPQAAAAVILLLAASPRLDQARLSAALASFGTPRGLAEAAGNHRDGKGAGRDAAVLAKRYNSDNAAVGAKPPGFRKLAVTPREMSRIGRDIGSAASAADEDRLFPWQDSASSYRSVLTRVRASELYVPLEYNRDPAKRARFLADQGPWCKALEGVLDVVEHEDGEKWVLDGGGRVWKKLQENGGALYVFDIRLHQNVGSIQSEHALFERLNGSRKVVMPVELFLGGLTVGQPIQSGIASVLAEFPLPSADGSEGSE